MTLLENIFVNLSTADKQKPIIKNVAKVKLKKKRPPNGWIISITATGCLLIVVLALCLGLQERLDANNQTRNDQIATRLQSKRLTALKAIARIKSSLVAPLPRQSVLAAQTDNLAPVVWRIPTDQPVVFLGIDDGWIQSPEILDRLESHSLPFSIFVTNDAAKRNYEYFMRLQSADMTIENHTLHHPVMTKLNLEQQKAEICATSDIYASVFGRRPTLFRPPYGKYNADTQQAAATCGMKAIIMWQARVEAGSMQFQKSDHLRSGDIVLMHFRSSTVADLEAFVKEVEDHHLKIGRLEDWLR